MPYYNTCPNCSASLDPGERCCDCEPGQYPRIADKLDSAGGDMNLFLEALDKSFFSRIINNAPGVTITEDKTQKKGCMYE